MHNSSFCFGSVFHRRFHPKSYAFKHNIAMPLLDLDEVNQLSKLSRWLSVNKKSLFASFHEGDYLINQLQPQENLKQRARRVFVEKSGEDFDGNIVMLANWRFLNVVFNPLTLFFYYRDNGDLIGLLAEVSNTPWNERYIYCHRLDPKEVIHKKNTTKSFHVSPFHSMDMDYRWQFSIGDKKVRFSLELMKNNQRHFLASFNLNRSPMSSAQFKHLIKIQPLMSIQTLGRIYWHALKLFLKRIPIYTHPNKINEEKSNDSGPVNRG